MSINQTKVQPMAAPQTSSCQITYATPELLEPGVRETAGLLTRAFAGDGRLFCPATCSPFPFRTPFIAKNCTRTEKYWYFQFRRAGENRNPQKYVRSGNPQKLLETT